MILYVDGSCVPNPGSGEYRGVDDAGKELFRKKIGYSTNNVAEFLAIVHGLAWAKREGVRLQKLYSDSKTAMIWVFAKRCRTKVFGREGDSECQELVRRAEKWLRENDYPDVIRKWHTKSKGEIPADFGRKNSWKRKVKCKV